MGTQAFVEAGAAGGSIPIPFDPSTSRDAERESVREAQSGDLAAFERLYRSNERKIFALCLRMTQNAAQAEELTQEVFVRAWQRLGSFRGESAFSSWLYPIAVRMVVSERRSRGRREAREGLFDDEAAEPEGFLPATRSPERLDLERAVATLPAGARLIFLLHDVEGYSHDEIASLTGVSEGTSKSQLHRARHLLREILR